MPTRNGSIRLFKLFGITVFLHWGWFIVAYFMIRYRTHAYTSPVFNVLEYLSLFVIVLMHEFGHQLACRSVGGQTHDIVLWPMGGVAFVSPPQRPGAQLWSIVAGPLVNVGLIPILTALVSVSSHLGWYDTNPNVYEFINIVWKINIGLLIFNLMPIYPLDGGQILRSLLWFQFGRANSLLVASIIGFIGMGGLLILAAFIFFVEHDEWSGGWLGLISIFIALNCWGGLRQALALARIAKIPRREGFACPECHIQPPQGAIWRCGKCRQAFDTFEMQGVCPHCGTQYAATSCPECGSLHPFSEWLVSGNIPPRL
jgi:Zn-dependent protease